MKVVLQRVKSASVSVDGELIASIGKGVLALAAIGRDDTVKDTETSASKLLNMKLWDDENGGRWKKSVKDIGGEVLCVSQFTLLASTKKGSKPSFHHSADAVKAGLLYSAFFTEVQKLYEKEKVKDGVFQAMMDVALVNDGPVSGYGNGGPVGGEAPASGVDGLAGGGDDRGREASPGAEDASTYEAAPRNVETAPTADEDLPPLPPSPPLKANGDRPARSPVKLPPMGIKYICDHEEVTLEIDTDPGPIDVPNDMQKVKVQGKMSVDELAEMVQEMAYNFEVSPELLE